MLYYSKQPGHAVTSSVILGSHGYSPYGAGSLFVYWERHSANTLSPVVTDKGGTQQAGDWEMGRLQRKTDPRS